MLAYMNEYSKTNPNKFSEDLLNLRKKDNIKEYLDDISKALEAIDGIKFLGSEIVTDESKFKPSYIKKEPEKFWRNINESRFDLIKLKFSVEAKDNKEIIILPLFLPKLIDNTYYQLNGNKYFAVYQLVDSSTYNNKDKVTLKSLLMPIVLKRNNGKLVDTNGTEYKAYTFQLHLFSFKINMLYYYFAKIGFTKTIKFFGISKAIRIVTTPSKNPNLVHFAINKNLYIQAKKETIKKSSYLRNIIACILACIEKNRLTEQKLDDIKFWKNKLGGFFTTNLSNRVEKAETVLKSFSRILDNRTKKCLRINDRDKKNTYCLVRWMFKNFNYLLKKDNLSLLTKRIRLGEYICTPFLRKMSEKTYNLLNNKNKSFEKKSTLFKNISPMYIIQKVLTMDMIRYNNSVNVMNLFSTLLKYSSRGPQSQSENGRKSVNISYRGVHPSHIGRLDLNSCSKGDPGMSGHFTPFVKLDGFYFVKRDELESEDE